MSLIPNSQLKTPFKKRLKTDLIVVHCSANGPTSDWGWRELHQLHVKENGWTAIGYNVVIKRDGTIEAGRPLDAVGAHASQVNSHAVGVVLIGGLGGKRTDPFEKNFTQAQAVSLVAVLKELQKTYPGAEICGHHDIPGANKECPAFPIKKWWAGL